MHFLTCRTARRAFPRLPRSVGNRVEIVDYENIQFTKAPNVLRGIGLDHLTKTESAKQQLTDKGMGGTDPFRGKQK